MRFSKSQDEQIKREGEKKIKNRCQEDNGFDATQLKKKKKIL